MGICLGNNLLSRKYSSLVYWCLAVILFWLAKSIHAEKNCSSPITDDHLTFLDDMIDAQLNLSCSVKVKLIDSQQLGEYCYKRGIISELFVLLEKLNFKDNSQSYNHTKILIKLYNQRFMDCIDEIDYISEVISPCSHDIDVSPVQILERVKMSFLIFRDFKANPKSDSECFKEYKMCKENHFTKGPHCACPSPTSPVLSGTATQKSLSSLPEFQSTQYTSTISTVQLAQYTSGTDSLNAQQGSQNIGMSSNILTSITANVQPLATITDNVHAAITDHLVLGPESPRSKKMDIEITKGFTEWTYTIGLPQTRTYPDVNIVNLNTGDSHTETMSVATTELSKYFTQLTRESPFVTETILNDFAETSELSVVSQSSVSNIQKNSVMEPDIESSSSTTVNIMGRSVENLDKMLKVHTSKHAQSVLPSDDSATKPPHLTKIIPPTLTSPQPITQANKIRNLGWADSYLLPDMLTTKPASSDAEMSSSVFETQSLSSETSTHPKSAAHKGGYTYNSNQKHGQNVADFIFEDREYRGPEPNYGFNLLPIPETERHKNERHNSNSLLIMVPSILAILLLCGLLYFIYQYRLLRRQIHREQAPELPELRPLAV